MSKCDIVIEFDKDDRTFRAGEIISGKVYVTPDTDMPCDGVLIEPIPKLTRFICRPCTCSRLRIRGMLS